MLVQRPACPDLGHPSRLLRQLASAWRRRGALDHLIDGLLVEACEREIPLRITHAETGIPKSTAHDRVQRRLAADGEVAA